MFPTLTSGEKVIIKKKWFFCSLRKGDIVVFHHQPNQKILIKRIFKKTNNKFFLIGDNVTASTDSRNFGYIDNKSIIGKVIFSKKNPLT